MPFDIGFSTLTYRTDKVQPKEISWNLLLDERYKGKISLYSDGVTIIKIGGLINGVKDPNAMTTDEIQAAKATMMKAAKNIRTFWTSETAAEKDFINENVWISYFWPDGYWKVKNDPKFKNIGVEYMWPKEGRLAWVCGFVLGSQTKVGGRAHAAVAAANAPKVAAWLTDAYQYGAAQQNGVQPLIKNQALIKAFSLDDPSAFAPPVSPGAHGAWFEKPLPNRAEYVKAAEEVKASVST